jgi:hypothetical protein
MPSARCEYTSFVVVCGSCVVQVVHISCWVNVGRSRCCSNAQHNRAGKRCEIAHIVDQFVVMEAQYMLCVLIIGGIPGGVDEVYHIIACGC